MVHCLEVQILYAVQSQRLMTHQKFLLFKHLLTTSNIILCRVFHEIFINIQNISNINIIIIDRKIIDMFVLSSLFLLSTKFFLNHFLTITKLHFFRMFCFRFVYFNIINKSTFTPSQCKFKQNFLLCSVKYIECFFLQSMQNIFTLALVLYQEFLSLSACTDELISAPKYYDVFTKPITVR